MRNSYLLALCFIFPLLTAHTLNARDYDYLTKSSQVATLQQKGIRSIYEVIEIHSPAMRNTIVLEMKPVAGGPTFTLSIFLRETIKDPLAATAIVAMLDAILDDDSQQVVIDPNSFGILNLGSGRVELHDLRLIQAGGVTSLSARLALATNNCLTPFLKSIEP